MNKITWTRKAQKQLLKIDKQNQVIIFAKVGTLVDFPNCENVRALVNHSNGYRLRVGQYRVIFDFDGRLKIVSIEQVKKRDSRTY